MLILLSCAKTMSSVSNIKVPFSTKPVFKKHAGNIARQMALYSNEELQRMLKVNSRIAEENRIRYKYFNREDYNQLEAILSYSGIVFKKLGLEDFTPEDFAYAQEHLRITSFSYGLLRPLDKIHQYRLEGNIVLPGLENTSMFEFWRNRLTDLFIEEIKLSGGILCNLASGEMKGLFDWKRVEKEVTVISPEFKTWKNGKLTTIVIYAKIARGEMARYIIKNRIERIEDLHLDELTKEF